MTPTDPARDQLLEAILPHVAFDGWTDTAFAAALTDTGTSADHGRAICPRGAVDLAVAYHKRGDAAMETALKAAPTADMRIRDKIVLALRLRLEAIDDKEAVRRGTTLFALPHMAATGAGLIWGTADAIWTAIGDSSDDINWYTKRATLAGVYSATVLYWLGDESPDMEATRAFIDRRIDDVMQIEKVKSQVNANPLLKPLTVPLSSIGKMVKAPGRMPRSGLPGSWLSPRRG